jgi:hypothetical protein
MIRMKSSDNPEDQLNLQSTYGALFFGVPSQGMNVEAMAAMINDLPARYNLNLLDQRLGFRLRNRQHEDFCKAFAYKDSRIIQFFETKKSPTVIQVSTFTYILPCAKAIQDDQSKRWSRNGPKVLLVDPASATHGRPWETGDDYILSLDGDHSTMIKFSENDRDGYEQVCDVVQDFIQNAGTVIGARIQGFTEGSTCPTFPYA